MTFIGRRRWRTWSLRRQLVVGVCGVVVTVLLAVGTCSVLTLRATVNALVSDQLTAASNSFSNAVMKYRASADQPGLTGMKPLTQIVGQSRGNVIALVRNGAVVDSALFSEGDPVPAPASALPTLAQVGRDGSNAIVRIPDLGTYRLTSRPGGPGEALVTGVSHRPASQTVERETLIVVGLTAVALLVTALSTLAVVRLALRPLERVAATAAKVLAVPLNREQYAITPRVADDDTDPSTEVGQVGDTLNKLLDHVEAALTDVAESDRRMRQFITDASHELRTPLAAIQGYAELTRQDSSVLPETTEYSLARIEAEAQRMNALVTGLLLLARLDEGQDLQTADVDLADLTVNAVNDTAASAPDHLWHTDVPDTARWVRGDNARLHQALTNLLSNARVHTPPGTTVTTTIVDATYADGSPCVDVNVSDSGPGIDSEILPHLFERFARADKARSRQAGSFGLGLAITSSIVEAHHGVLSAHSEGNVTTFTMRLPVRVASTRSAAGAIRPSNSA